jgi:hypothetical protein
MFGDIEQEKEKRIATVREALAGATELTDADKTALIQSNFMEFSRVITAHRGHKASRKLESLTVARAQFDMACATILEILDEFHVFSDGPGFQSPDNRVPFNRIIDRMRKELFTFSDLAHSVQDHARRVDKVWSSPGYSAKLAEHFGSDRLHNFVIVVRNALHHLHVFDAEWALRWNDAGEKSAHFNLKKFELLEDHDDWGAAKPWLEAAPAEIDVRALVTDYRARHAAFYDWYLGWCAANMPAEVAEYRALKLGHRQHLLRMEWNFLLREFLKRSVDPMAYLARFLTSKQVAEAKRLPPKSQALVEFVIECVDETGGCTPELREMAYKLFDVPGAQGATQAGLRQHQAGADPWR